MLLFNVTVREHTYTGRFHNDVVEAGSCEEALHLAAGKQPRLSNRLVLSSDRSASR